MDDISVGIVRDASKAKTVGNYDLIKTIGEGSFATVKIATCRFNGQQVAIKIIDKTKLPEGSNTLDIYKESNILRHIDHPNIIQLFEVMETKKKLYLVLEIATGGEVLDEIMKQKKFTEEETRRITRQVVSALVLLLNLCNRIICIQEISSIEI